MLVALQTRDKVRIRAVNGLLVVKRLTEAARSRHHTPATCWSRHAVSLSKHVVMFDDVLTGEYIQSSENKVTVVSSK